MHSSNEHKLVHERALSLFNGTPSERCQFILNQESQLNISEDEITEIAAKVGKDAVKDIALLMKHSIDTFLDWFETRMKTASVEISHQRLDDDSNNNRTHSYIIRRDFRIWSIFHKTILESILQEMSNKPLKNFL